MVRTIPFGSLALLPTATTVGVRTTSCHAGEAADDSAVEGCDSAAVGDALNSSRPRSLEAGIHFEF